MSRDEVAFRSLFTPVSSGFRNSLSVLRTFDLIVGSDPLLLTPVGRRELNGSTRSTPPTGTALLHWWSEKIDGRCERALLEVLVSAYPEPVDRTALAQRAGYDATSSGYRNALSKLRKPRIIAGSKQLGVTRAFANAVFLSRTNGGSDAG